MLPPGTVGTPPSASVARIDTPPVAPTPMSTKSTPSPPGAQQLEEVDGGKGGTGLADWVCCVGKKVERAVHVTPPRPGEQAMV